MAVVALSITPRLTNSKVLAEMRHVVEVQSRSAFVRVGREFRMPVAEAMECVDMTNLTLLVRQPRQIRIIAAVFAMARRA